MSRSTVAGLLMSCLAATMPSHGQAQSAARGELAARCVAAARVAEAATGLPEGLLVAVAVVESALHPYAVGSERDARYAATPAQAMRAVRAMAPAARSVSGGCFQVNIGVHAKRSPAWVFDPGESAIFAARLLDDLRRRHGDWAAALAAYNGAAPQGTAGRAYACRVRAALAEVAPASVAAIRPGGCASATTRALRAKAATLLAIAGEGEVELAEAEAR